MLSVSYKPVMFSVIMLSVVMLSVAVPFWYINLYFTYLSNFSLRVAVAGFEPLILGLRVECSTTVPLGTIVHILTVFYCLAAALELLTGYFCRGIIS
jgi:hypothetical protein